MKRLVMGLVFIAIAAGGYGAWWWWNKATTTGATESKSAKGGKGRRGRGGPLFVKAVNAVKKPMPVQIEAVGSVEPEHSVQVRAQVSGVLQSVMFKEGDKVNAGQLLFQIDPRTFEASYRQSQAQLARDMAQLENARVQQERLEPLLKREYITRQEFDVAVTSTKSLEATVAADRALVEQARIQMEYSRIHAPISGRTGALAVKSGNLVAAGAGGGGAPLVTINSTDPILVAFSIPERQLEDIRRHQNEKEMRIEILPDRNGPPFVNVRVVLKIEPDALVVPDVAVQPGQEGSFVYLIDSESKVRVRPVKVSRQIGTETVIAAGIRAGDQVITEIPQALQEGATVRIAGSEPAKKGKGKGRKKGEKKKSEAKSEG